MNLNEKLELISKFSNGIFVSGQVTNGTKETDLLQKKRKLKVGHFEEIYRSPYLNRAPIILRLTQDFCNENSPGFFVKEPESKKEVLNGVLWSGIIIDWELYMSCPKGVFEFNGTELRLDTFDEDVFEMKGKNVVTLPFREELLKASDLRPIIPQSLTGGWTKELLKEFASNSWQPEQSDSMGVKRVFSDSRDWIDGSIWPVSSSECHKDKREYIGVRGPITGEEKWSHDKTMARLMIEKGKTPKDYDDYKFGVYPIMRSNNE